MRDPRTFDLYVRSITTSLIVVVVLAVVAWQAVHGSPLEETFKGWGGLIVGAYIGTHMTLNGAGARARQDQKLAEAIAAPAPVEREL